MKIALPSRDGVIDGHFGHCEVFTIYSIENDAIVAEEKLTPPPGCGCKSSIIPTLAEMGVTVLIGGNMGQGAVNKLEEAGIKVIRGAQGDLREATTKWLAGDLKTTVELCTSHGHFGCGHH